jgi:hypothetical protein
MGPSGRVAEFPDASGSLGTGWVFQNWYRQFSKRPVIVRGTHFVFSEIFATDLIPDRRLSFQHFHEVYSFQRFSDVV